MEGYLGDTVIDIASHPTFSTYTPADWAMKWIELYGSFDGESHKTWALDQVSRILKGTKVIVTEAKWSNGHSEYRFTLDKPTAAYEQWVDKMLGGTGPDGEREYDYDTGVAP